MTPPSTPERTQGKRPKTPCTTIRPEKKTSVKHKHEVAVNALEEKIVKEQKAIEKAEKAEKAMEKRGKSPNSVATELAC